jgi:hypothetical protein
MTADRKARGVPGPWEALVRLTEEALAHAATGDADALEALADEREAALATIVRAAAPVEGETVRQVLELQQALMEQLVATRARLGEELRQIAACRRLLESYRGASAPSAVYFEGRG